MIKEMKVVSDIYNELLQYVIRREVEQVVSKLEYNITDKANSLATEILEEIVSVLREYELSDFDIVEKIVCIMEEYEIDCGSCHDFG